MPRYFHLLGGSSQLVACGGALYVLAIVGLWSNYAADELPMLPRPPRKLALLLLRLGGFEMSLATEMA